jgi:geranylgeranyl pyrophosphate synthase
MTAGTNEDQLADLSAYAERVGLAFQIADDVLNATASSAQMGKSSGTDASSGKMTYVAAYGVDGARSRASALIDEAKASLRNLPGDSQALAALADFVIAREK